MNVVVTGIGAVSAIGSGEAFFEALRQGASGITEVTILDPGESASTLAAEIAEFAVEEYLESAKTYLDRTSAFTLAAGALALRDSGYSVAAGEGLRAGVTMGTAYGCLGTMGAFWEGVLEKGPRLSSSLLFTHSYINTPVSLASIEFNLAGPHGCFCEGAASAGHALAEAATQLALGRADAMLAGGGESLSTYLYRGYAGMGWLSPGEGGSEGMRPFAASRNGCVLGEGAGFLLLEREEAARQRGARPRARLLGVGLGGGLAGGGAAAAMRAALAEAGVTPAEVDALFASAAGMREADAAEAAGIEEVFGGRCVPVVTLKAALGETLGASGALAALAAVHALETGLLPGAPNVGESEFSLDLVREPRTATCHYILVNAFDPRGGCVSLLFGRA